MRERLINAKSASGRSPSVVESGPELLVAGVLAVVLALAIVRSTMPPLALPILGGLAFCAMIAIGARSFGSGKASGSASRHAGCCFFALVWIAAGIMTDPAAVMSSPG